MMLPVAIALVVACAAPPGPAQSSPAPPAPTAAPKQDEPRVTSELMKAHAGKVIVTASSFWPGWGTARLVDGDAATSWFSAKGDAAAKGKKPWVQLAFPVAVEVRRVTLLGNREPSWPSGFTVHYGVLELLDDKGAVLASVKNEGKNKVADVEFPFKQPVSGVRAVRFTSLMDEGDKTSYEDIALAEIVVE